MKQSTFLLLALAFAFNQLFADSINQQDTSKESMYIRLFSKSEDHVNQACYDICKSYLKGDEIYAKKVVPKLIEIL